MKPKLCQRCKKQIATNLLYEVWLCNSCLADWKGNLLSYGELQTIREQQEK